jgi:ribonuclease/clavin/mitogillin
MNIVNVGYDSTNYYVLGNASGRLLIDTGWPGTMPKIVAALKRATVNLSEIGYLLVTHFHPDHAGLVQELKNRGLRLLLPEIQVPAIPLLRTCIKPSFPYIEINLNDNLKFRLEESRAVLAGIGFAGTILSTPGHSNDSITLVLDDGSAFTGDLYPPMMADPAAQAAVARSWEAIRARGAKRIYPGHGPIRPIADVVSY